MSCVICPQASMSVSFLQNGIRHLEFLLQSGTQHRLGEPGLACLTPGSCLCTDALSHSGTKWNIRVLRASQASPLT